MNNRLKLLRKNLGLTQAEFAEKLGITPTYLSEIERGNRHPAYQFFLALINEFGVNLNWLFTERGEQFINPVEHLSELDPLSEEVLSILKNLPEDRRKGVLNYVRDQKIIADVAKKVPLD